MTLSKEHDAFSSSAGLVGSNTGNVIGTPPRIEIICITRGKISIHITVQWVERFGKAII